MRLFWLVLAVLVCWAAVVYARSRREKTGSASQGGGRTDAPAHGRAGKGRHPDPGGATADDDAINYEELERAERELRDLDAAARPEDRFEGEDWGPGAPKPPAG